MTTQAITQPTLDELYPKLRENIRKLEVEVTAMLLHRGVEMQKHIERLAKTVAMQAHTTGRSVFYTAGRVTQRGEWVQQPLPVVILAAFAAAAMDWDIDKALEDTYSH